MVRGQPGTRRMESAPSARLPQLSCRYLGPQGSGRTDRAERTAVEKFREMKLQIFDTRGDLFQAAAQEFATRAENSVKDHGRFCVALSGGSTPKGLFTLLATGGAFPNIPWDKLFLFWGDERHVPPDHADSNYRMTKESLLCKVPIPSANVFRIKAETEDADAAAREYEQTLKICFGLRPGEFPRFDLVLQGMGSEGHTASLFPGSPALEEQGRLVVAPWVEKFNTYRIS